MAQDGSQAMVQPLRLGERREAIHVVLDASGSHRQPYFFSVGEAGVPVNYGVGKETPLGSRGAGTLGLSLIIRETLRHTVGEQARAFLRVVRVRIHCLCLGGHV